MEFSTLKGQEGELYLYAFLDGSNHSNVKMKKIYL